MEIFLHHFPLPGTSVETAVAAEAEGWNGLLLADSQNLQAEVFVELALVARATERLRIGPGVTNPITRHPAVTASAAATLQAESGGRAILQISRGDSSVSFIGKGPAPVDVLESYVSELQAYLRGDVVYQDGFASRLEWVHGSAQPKVPVDVVATGPRNIAVGARQGDRITFTLGAGLDAIDWAIDTARKASAAAGRDLPPLGAYVIVAVHPDIGTAREMVRGNVGIFANFLRSEATLSRLSASDREVVENVRVSFEPVRHGLSKAAHTTALSDEFIDGFAVIGPPRNCIGRLRDLLDRGVERLVVLGPSKDVDTRLAAQSRQRFAAEVLPALRERSPRGT